MKSRSITEDKRSLHHGCERIPRLALYTFCQNKIIAGYPRLRHKAYIDLLFASLSFTPIVESENLLCTIMEFTVWDTQ
ncbi:hypothetical protein T08_4089 [Trichinella sp. T8]|nr:hypothetical protein T08_4089 [Trichinella sp. T8]